MTNIWLLPESREELRNRIVSHPDYRPILERLSAEGDLFMGEPIPELRWTLFRRIWEDGNRKTYEAVIFNRRQRLTAFGILSWLWPDREDYRDALLDTVWAVCSEFSWCVPAHFSTMPGTEAAWPNLLQEEWMEYDPACEIDLFAAETAFALSEVLQLTGDTWPEAVRNRVYRETYRRVFVPFMKNRYFWESVRNNWAAVCAGSIGAAAIHMMEDGQELENVLSKVMPTLDLFLEGFGEDGACLEGYMYWAYGFGYYTCFAELLEKRTGGDVNLFAPPKVREIACFQEKSFMSGRKVVNFSDSPPESDVNIGLSHELSRRFPGIHVPEYDFQGKAVYDHCGRWATALRNLIWYDPDLHGSEWREGSWYLPDAQWLVSRVHKPEGCYSFAAKGGHNDEPHNHNDIGHFILMADGETFLADMGSGLYTKQYFGPARYSFVCNGSQGHSVPVIEGGYQLQGSASRAEVLQADIGSECDRFGLELKDAYGQSALQTLERRWVWRKDSRAPVLQMEDRFVFTEGGSSVTERFICAMQPVNKGPGRIELEGSRYRLVILYDGSILDPDVEPVTFLNHFGKELMFYALNFNWNSLEAGLTHRLHFEFQFEKVDYI